MAERSQVDHIYDSSGKLNSTGSANAYVIEVAEQIAGYHQGMPPIRFKANFGNTGSATANIATQTAPSGLGAVTLKKFGGATDLASGDIVSGGVYTLIYDGTNFQVLELNTGIIVSANLADDSVTNAKLANMAEATIKGRAVGAGTGDPTDLTATQATAILNVFTSALKGLVPASGGGTTTFLRADATFATPPVSIVAAVAQGSLSSVATLDLALGSLDMYEIDLINILPVTDNVALYARVSQSGSFLSGAADYGWNYFRGATEQSDASDSEIGVADGVGNGATEFSTITFRIFRPSAAAFQKGMHWHGYECLAADGHIRHLNGAGRLIANTDAIDGVQFLFSSGNIASGYYAIRSYSFT